MTIKPQSIMQKLVQLNDYYATKNYVFVELININQKL